MANLNRYQAVISEIFKRHYKVGETSFAFKREEIEEVANKLRVQLPKNLGDLIYSFRFRNQLPESIALTAPKGLTWTIELAGKAQYKFCLNRVNRILPTSGVMPTKIPDATPEIISKYALTDEQAVLARIRYNRLIDVFLGIASYSLQNHLRTTVKGIGQIEIDELYVGVDGNGKQYIIPVQAKGHNDEIGSVQSKQDIACCAEKFVGLVCRPIATQSLSNGVIAIFELALKEDYVTVVKEKQYRLVRADEISALDLASYEKSDTKLANKTPTSGGK